MKNKVMKVLFKILLESNRNRRENKELNSYLLELQEERDEEGNVKEGDEFELYEIVNEKIEDLPLTRKKGTNRNRLPTNNEDWVHYFLSNDFLADIVKDNLNKKKSSDEK